MPLNLIPHKMEISLWKFLIVIALWAFCFQLHVGFIQSQCLHDQQSLLLQLKENLSFDSAFSTKLVYWNSSTDCCVWGGVTCSNGGLVIGLDLSNESITGGIDNSSSLFDLHHLQSLNLSSNRLGDTQIPSGFSKLAGLEYLNLSYSGFFGQVPAEISGLTRLVSLSLGSVYLSEGAPALKLENPNLSMLVRNLTRLGELNLRGADLSAEGHGWCRSLSTLTRLRVLNLAECKLSGSIDSSLAKLRSLSVINLAGSLISGQVPEFFGNFSDLTSLDLSDCSLNGTFPEKIFQLPHLQHLDVSSNHDLQGLIPEFPENGSLETLVLTDTSFGGRLPQSIGNQERLSWIEISQCNFNGPIPDSMAKLARLVYLDFSYNNFNDSIDSSLAKLRSLSVINLAGNLISGQVPEFFGNFSDLTSLDLSFCSLNGTFPEKIFQLPHLQNLDISGNSDLQGLIPEFPENGSLETLVLTNTSFGGHLPDSMANLERLSWIDIAQCNFSGLLPSFSSAKNLSHINLSNNHLSGSILSTNWSGLSMLVSLDLSNNSLTGAIPKSLFGNPSLLLVYLDHNQFSGIQDGAFGYASSAIEVLGLSSNKLRGPVNVSLFQQMRNLSWLELSFNGVWINDTGVDLASLPLIHTINLASCQLTGFPTFLKEQTELWYLDLSNNKIGGDIPDWIGQLEHLSYLNLSHNFLENFQGQGFKSYLSVLDLSANKLEGRPPNPLAEYVDYSSNNFNFIPSDIGEFLSYTQFFSLANNNLRGSIPQSICNVTFLFVLNLSNNSLNGTIPQCLFGMGSLQVLNLGRNNLSGNISDTFSSDCEVKTIDLNGNHLEGRVPRSLANCTSLEVLDLGNNHFYDTFPCHLRTLSTLRVLILRSNRFQGSIGCSNGNFSWQNLQIIDLASNNFSGILPVQDLTAWKAMMYSDDEVRQIQVGTPNEATYYQDSVTIVAKGLETQLVKILTIFTSIDFSCNNFEGKIPEEIGEFKVLYILNFSHNSFTSRIPTSMGNLRSLESLDLSNNNLSGKIPQQLADLNFLAVLNLSRNQLEGRIPSGGQFQTFSEDSFKDNKGLCGVLLNVSCSPNAPPPPRAFDDKHSNDGIHVNWKFLSVELGFVFGLALVILPLMFWRRWRIWYYRHADVLLSRLFPRWMQRSRNRGSRTSRRAQLRERNKMVGEVALQPRISRVRRGRRTGVIVV